jgi:hypothetical protein
MNMTSALLEARNRAWRVRLDRHLFFTGNHHIASRRGWNLHDALLRRDRLADANWQRDDALTQYGQSR